MATRLALADQIKTGVPLIEAINNSPRSIASGSGNGGSGWRRVGRLVRALEATSFGSRFDRTLLQTVISRLFYILPAVLLFTLFMNIKIAPSYVKIFDDFNTALPPITIAVLQPTSSAFAGYVCFS